MARRKMHVAVGVASGAGAALYCARWQPPEHRIVETIGGMIGGPLGGVFPDVLEPATSSRHRSVAHSWAVLGLDAAAITSWAGRWQEHCRAEAGRQDQLQTESTDQLARLWHGFLAALWRLLSGFAVGFLTGYGSHLVLDVATPRSLPLLG